MSNRPGLLTPQVPTRESPHYRRVWRTAAFEIALLLIGVGLILLITRVLPIAFGGTQRRLIGVALAVSPLGLWALVSYRAERQAQQPRSRLLLVIGLTLLAANAIGVPLVDRLFAPDSWLANADGLTRLFGYTLTAGITAEFLKFAVIRYSVWQDCFRIRIDGVAYSMAAAIAYGAVLNVNFALNEIAEPAAIALRVAGVTLSQLAIGTIMGYWLGELKFSKPAIFWLPLSLGFAALLQGLYTVLRGSFVVGGFSGSATGSLPAIGLGAAIGLVALIFPIVSFLINSTNARERRSPEFLR